MEELRARVISQEKGIYRLRSERGEKLAEVSGRFRYDARVVSDFPAVGDYVITSWPEDDSRAIISMLFPRQSVFLRKAAGKDKQEQVVAANIDTVFLCMSLNRDFNLRRLERYLAIAWDSGAVPVVVLTKKDLCDDVPAYVQRTQDTAMGVEILVVSSLDSSYEELMEYIHPGKTYALIGSSGVGKSTLINRLTGGNIRTDSLRNDDKGHHTTTHRELIELACGAYVIDTPGMRELGMWDSADGIDMVFSDIEELAVHCRFKNCSHETEPGCAIQQALAEGRLASERWNSYRKLALENAFAADQSGYLEAKKEKFKAISRINKKNRKK